MTSFLRAAALTDSLLPSQPVHTTHQPDQPRPSLLDRVSARLMAGRYDQQLANGVVVPRDALTVHASRITSRSQRADLIKNLQRYQVAATTPPSIPNVRVPLNRAQIIAAATLIGDIVDRLCRPQAGTR